MRGRGGVKGRRLGRRMVGGKMGKRWWRVKDMELKGFGSCVRARLSFL